jgi:hypothetical protein
VVRPRRNYQPFDPLVREDLPRDWTRSGGLYLKRTANTHRTISEDVVADFERDLDVIIDIGT